MLNTIIRYEYDTKNKKNTTRYEKNMTRYKYTNMSKLYK